MKCPHVDSNTRCSWISTSVEGYMFMWTLASLLHHALLLQLQCGDSTGTKHSTLHYKKYIQIFFHHSGWKSQKNVQIQGDFVHSFLKKRWKNKNLFFPKVPQVFHAQSGSTPLLKKVSSRQTWKKNDCHRAFLKSPSFKKTQNKIYIYFFFHCLIPPHLISTHNKEMRDSQPEVL